MGLLASARTALVVVASGALLSLSAVPVGSAVTASPAGVDQCDEPGASAARVRSRDAAEPAQDPNAPAYGQIASHDLMAAGSVIVPTRFNLIVDHDLKKAEKRRWTEMVQAQMQVLNASFGGTTSAAGSVSPFRFELANLAFVNAPQWHQVVPGQEEREMKRELWAGGSRTLNVYAADIGGGLLGWAYFPNGYNNGNDYLDGVVMLDESMPGGTAGKYAEGDTLTHEVGHWLALHHTFNNGCSASNDFVEDTPKEAHPQFDCPTGADTCTAPGLDPVHNFMDYTQDSCMNMFTAGQVQRMNDAWIEFRA